MLDLDAIKRRADAASPGPWEGDVTGVYDDIARKMCPMFVHRDEDEPQAEANAVFMAHARQDVPALIAEVEWLRAENNLLRREREEARENRPRPSARHYDHPSIPKSRG